jgi:nucleoside-diphosphate-sugar epimerase
MLDTSRAHELFGFRARTGLRDGLERTIAWYRAAKAATVA